MSSSEVTTLILRFRDLGTAPGTTITSHRELIRKHTYTWWGWWHKFGERVPVKVFTELAKRVREEGPLEIYLLDSGRQEIRSAEISQFFWEPDCSLVDSKEQDATPEYYRQEKFLAWFKISKIEEAPKDPEIIKQFSYVDIDDFFENTQSRFSQYHGVRVGSLEELIEQNRTIWFVRRSHQGDREKPLPVADETSPHRSPFSKTWVASPGNSLLLLSDLHFGHHAFPLEQSIHESSLSLSLENDLKRLDKRTLGGVLVSGDLSWKADCKEFEETINFFEQINKWSNLNWTHFVVCPGNHDLRFSSNPADKDEPVSVAADEAIANYTKFYQKFFQHEPGDSLSMGKRFLLSSGLRVEVAALNSSLLQQQANFFQGHGFIGRIQLDETARGLGWPEGGEITSSQSERSSRRPFRIVMIHHHLVPVPFREVPYPEHRTSVVFDAEALVRWIVERQVDLVVHGHMHEPFVCQISRPVLSSKRSDLEKKWHNFVVLGLGSAGVKRDHLYGEPRNTYGLLEFERDKYKVILRRIDPKDEIQNQDQDVWTLEFPYPESVRF